MSISFHPFVIYKYCTLYLVIPILFFFLGWLRIGLGLLLSLLLLFATFYFLKKVKELEKREEIIILSKEFYISFLLLFLFLLSTGNTGFIGSWGVDIPWRNAIYQDLIHQSWPVVYEYSHSIMCYYMTFWLVPAAFASWLQLNEFGSNIVLFLWMYFGLVLVFFLLCDLLKLKKENIVLITIMFLFFSGVNMFGLILKNIFLEPTPIVLNFPGRANWSFSDYNVNGIDIVLIIRSIYLCIADVYNQFFAIAISTFLFLKFREYTFFYVFIGILVLPYSPLGFIGIFAVEFLEFLIGAFKRNSEIGFAAWIANSISLTNVLALLSIAPIFYFYFSMNSNAEALLSLQCLEDYPFLTIPLNCFTSAHITLLLLYYYFYFIIYASFIYESFKGESLYYEILFCLIIFPFFKVGQSADFNFNATICPYLLLFFLIARHILRTINLERIKFKDISLIFFLSIAMITPITQIATTFRTAYIHGSISYKWSPWDSTLSRTSFKDKDVDVLRNFLVVNYEKKVFYRYCIKN